MLDAIEQHVAAAGEVHALLEAFERALERQLATLEISNCVLETIEDRVDAEAVGGLDVARPGWRALEVFLGRARHCAAPKDSHRPQAAATPGHCREHAEARGPC